MIRAHIELELDEQEYAHLKETPLESEDVFSGILLNIRRDRVRLPNGQSSLREYVLHPGAAVILALLDNGNLLFERQFRYPLRRVFLELPAGKIDAGEDALTTARRELREETGYAARHWERLGLIHPCIGYSDERIEIFIARGLEQTGPKQLDPNEFLEVVEISPKDAKQAVWDGRITDAKTLAALFWLDKAL